MHVRASAQDPDDPQTLYALTQECCGRPSLLFVLQLHRGGSAVGITVSATIELPPRGASPGEGGADVIAMGGHKVLVTDRFGPPGPGMMYLYDLTSLVDDAAAGTAPATRGRPYPGRDRHRSNPPVYGGELINCQPPTIIRAPF